MTNLDLFWILKIDLKFKNNDKTLSELRKEGKLDKMIGLLQTLKKILYLMI